MEKIRLDDYLVREGVAGSKSRAQAIILAGEVLVNEVVVNKKGYMLRLDRDIVRVRERARYVSRGGEKLEHALSAFGVSPADRVCLDIGASTGGFTDCLLQHGARFVHALDVGCNQIAYSLRKDPRVAVYEKAHARALAEFTLAPTPDLIVTDVSFISVTKIAPAVLTALPDFREWIVLVKPQFEAERDEVGKGVIRDSALRERIVTRFFARMEEAGLTKAGVVASPITGAKGNIEYLALFLRQNEVGEHTHR